MSPAVRIVDTSYVFVPATTTAPPQPVKLTAMEAAFVAFPVLQHVLLFEGAQMPPFDAVLQSLRSSLAMALASFAPLAGNLVHLKDTGDVAISCSASDGVKFVVAKSDADVRRLALDEEHDLPVLEQLVPDVNMTELPTAVLAVQATGFEGGVAVGLTVHHAVADGVSLWAFVEAWAAACRGQTPAATPTFDRSLIKLPGGEELARRALREWAPNLPMVTPPPSFVEEEPRRFTRRTFTLDARDIERLKQQVVRLGEAHGQPLPRPPSTFTAVVALAWACFARCKPFASDEDVALLFLADARGRLGLPVDTVYIGCCITHCVVKLPARELRGERALPAAASAVQEEVRRMREIPVTAVSVTPLCMGPMDRLMNVSGSSRFRAYEIADFGWGKPKRTEPIRMNHDGQIALVGAQDGQGVQVSVALLQPAQMDEFKSQLHKLLA